MTGKLLNCALKKSADVLERVVLYASYVIVAITAIVIVILGVTQTWDIFADKIQEIISIVISFLFGIPWYVYAGGIVIFVIPLYSLAWCIARGLSEEDWASDEAKDIALAIVLAIATIAIAFALAIVLAIATIAIAFALAIVLAIAADSKLFLFIGAYLHYRKRMKKEV